MEEEDENHLNVNGEAVIEELEVDKGENRQKLNQESAQKDVSRDKNRTVLSDVVKCLEKDIKECLEHLSKFHIRSRQFLLLYKNNASEPKDGNMEKCISVSSKEILECSNEKQSTPVSSNGGLECNNEEQSTLDSSDETLECNNEQHTDPVSCTGALECKNEEQSTLHSSDETLECSNEKQLNPVSSNETSECSNKKQSNPALSKETLENKNDIQFHPSNKTLKHDNFNAKGSLERKSCHGKQTNQLLVSIAELSRKMEKMKRCLQSQAAKSYQNNSRSNPKELDDVNSKEIPSPSSPKVHLKIAGLCDTNKNKVRNDELVPPTTRNKSNTTDAREIIDSRRIQKFHRGNTHYSVFHKNNVPNPKAETFQWTFNDIKQHNNPQSPASAKASEVKGRIKDFLHKYAGKNYNVFRSYKHISMLPCMNQRNNEKSSSPKAKSCIEIDPKKMPESKRKGIESEEILWEENTKMRKKQRQGSPQVKSRKRYVEIPARDDYESESESNYREYHATKCRKRRKVSRDRNLNVTSRYTGHRYATGYTDSETETSSVESYVSDRWRKGKNRFEEKFRKHKKTCKKHERSPSHKRFRRPLSPDYHHDYEDEYSGYKREHRKQHEVARIPERNAALKTAIRRYTDNSRKHPPIKSYIADTSEDSRSTKYHAPGPSSSKSYVSDRKSSKYRAPRPPSSIKSYIGDRREDSRSRKHVGAGGKFPKNEYDTRSEAEMPEGVPSTSYKHFVEPQNKNKHDSYRDSITLHETSDHTVDHRKTQKISQRVSVRNVNPLKNAILRYTNNTRKSCIQPVPRASMESHVADTKKVGSKITVKQEIVSEDKEVGRSETRIVEPAPSTSKSGVAEKVMNEIVEMLVENCKKIKLEPESPPKAREQFDLRNKLNKKKEKEKKSKHEQSRGNIEAIGIR